MNAPSRADSRLVWLSAALSIGSVAAFLWMAAPRGSWHAVAGDESTFLAMTESLALDGDLEFTRADSERLGRVESRPRKTIILQRSAGRIGYSKPVVYPLFGAPFYKLFGRPGLWLLNILALAGALALFWRSVRESPDRSRWLLTIATFAATGAVLPQLAWTTGDTLQLALALGGTTLALAPSTGRVGRGLGGLMLGLLIVMRLPNAILVGMVVIAALVGRRRGALALALQVVVAVALASLLNAGMTGALNPYKAERATFNQTTGYPVAGEVSPALEQFETNRATQRLGVVPKFEPRVTGYASLYFLVGRHTGLLWYFPIAVVLVGAALPRASRESVVLVVGALGLAAFYLIWMPENYFGGASFVGNRYLLPALGLLLVAVRRPPAVKALLTVWVLSAGLAASALLSISVESERPFSSQSHAFAGLARLAPYESTALSIENRQDRYLSDEFVRFVDRSARVGEHGFHLRQGAPPAEILLASARPYGILRFLVLADAPDAELVFSDRKGEQRFELPPHPRGSGGLVEVTAAPAWRRHPFWFGDEVWHAHSVRLSLESETPGEALADVRYLGPYRTAAKFFGYRKLRAVLPESGVAGETVGFGVRLENRGARPWASDGDVPVHLVHSLQLEGAAGVPATLEYTEIPQRVGTRERVIVEVEVRWPEEPGRYVLEVDLALAGVEPFRNWVGEPVARTVVDVRAAEAVVTSR